MKVCITGSTRGVGKLIASYFKLRNCEVKSFDRNNTYEEIILGSLDCDLFVNNAYGDGLQIKLLEELHTKIKKIIVCGSIAADSPDPEMPVYSKHKKELQERFYELTQTKNNNVADMLLLKLTSSSVKDHNLLHNTIDYWLKNPQVIEVRFDIRN